ncbi:FecR domain-containing protein [Sphingobacterium sp. UME9]|uniref:FecR family protein n=1 Tax=Sphingobacterium TaxID=28453 RepID=UPI0016017093|nr:FecR domain-containing protein [Sphingobacterium sp. UME9]MBB1642757.1 hypothetical protein [Sphingobacterium sp. UME9]
MENNQIQYLFEKYLKGTITGQELGTLLDLFHAENVDEDLMAKIRSTLSEENVPNNDQVEEITGNVKEILSIQLRPRPNANVLWIYRASAAAILLAFAIAVFYVFDQQQKSAAPTTIAKQLEIHPGTDKAELILSDGSKVSLFDKGTLQNSKDGIASLKDGTLTYGQQTSEAALQNEGFNTVRVPMGGQFKVVLADGSKVWLNAGSSIKYPVSFGITSRKIELTGEAYFQVAKNKKLPFTVKSTDMEVTALGTEFNFNTYSNEPFGAATLLEGSLRILNSRSQKTVIIIPGEQAIVAGDELRVLQVNGDDYSAWKDGLFVVNKATLNAFLRQVARWYNVDIAVVSNGDSGTISGEFPKNIPIADLIHSLKKVTGVKLKIEGRRIVEEK